MRRNKIVYILWLVLFLLAYLRHGAAAPLVILIFSLIYGILAFASVRLCGRGLSVSLRGGDMMEKGGEMQVRMKIRNGSGIPVPLCEGRVLAWNRLTEERQWIPLSLSLGPKGETGRTITITDRYCGQVDVGVWELTVLDPLKIFGRARKVRTTCTGYFTPRIGSVPIPAEYLDSYDMESYQYSQYEKGTDPGEVFGVREYQEGDSPKQIHWKLSAKMDEMMVKIPSYPIENNILLILDNLLAPGTRTDPDRCDGLMELFCSLSAGLLEKDLPHSIGWFDCGEQRFCQQAVRSREELWRCLPKILGCGMEESSVSTVYRYLETLQDQGFSNHFLVTFQEERDIEKLEDCGAVKVFRTTEYQA